MKQKRNVNHTRELQKYQRTCLYRRLLGLRKPQIVLRDQKPFQMPSNQNHRKDLQNPNVRIQRVSIHNRFFRAESIGAFS